MKWILCKALLMLMICSTRQAQAAGNVYDVWNDNGLHLMVCDNGTPANFEDDFIVDWEDNRAAKVTILDN